MHIEIESRVLIFGRFTFTPATSEVRIDSGKSAHLSPELCIILNQLVAVKGEMVAKEVLYEGICERRHRPPKPKVVDVQICKLRRIIDKLSPNGGNHIITVWGEGYRLSDDPQYRMRALQYKRGPRGDTPLLKRLNRLRTEYLSM